MLVCLLGVRRKVGETMPVVQHPQPGQVAISGLLGVHRQESFADSCCHTQRYFQATQCTAGRFSYYSDKKGL